MSRPIYLLIFFIGYSFLVCASGFSTDKVLSPPSLYPSLQVMRRLQGDYGFGVTYLPGQLQALKSGAFRTRVVIQREGVPGSSGFIFSTATNRIQDPLEIVVIYPPGQAGGFSLGIFDWSCSSASPCRGGVTVPSWILTQTGPVLECYIEPYFFEGTLFDTIQYINHSKMELAANETGSNREQWINQAFYWNVCRGTWDQAYFHRFQKNHSDCSITNCSWWGPIVETFLNPASRPPHLRNLGFLDTSLMIDGQLVPLDASQVRWKSPAEPWKIFSFKDSKNWVIGDRPFNLTLK